MPESKLTAVENPGAVPPLSREASKTKVTKSLVGDTEPTGVLSDPEQWVELHGDYLF